MFRCRVCGSIGQTPQACGVCGGAVREISQDPSGQSTVSRQLLRPFWTGTKIAAMMIVVLFAVSTVGAGLYLSARPSGPSCSNGALNYPSCNSCGSSEAYSSSTKVCFCTDHSVNPPAAIDFVGITRSILQTATLALIIIQMSSAHPAHLLRPTRPRTVIASHIHSRKARTVLFQKGRCRYRRSGDIISDGYVVILRVRMPQTRSTV